MSADDVTFLVSNWLPDPDVLNESGQALLDIAGGVLDSLGYGDAYTRRVFGHGTVPTEPGGDQHPAQIKVTAPKIFLGRAGEEQYRFPAGSPGVAGFITAQYDVELVQPWPVRQGAPAVPVESIEQHRETLLRDAFIVFAAYRAVMLGGIKPSARRLNQDGMMVGPMVPKGPLGRMATWVITVHVQV